MKTKDKRCRDPRIKCWVYIVAKGAKYNRKHNILNNFPPNKDNNKSQAVFLKKSLQVLFGEVVKFIRYSSFEPINHKFFWWRCTESNRGPEVSIAGFIPSRIPKPPPFSCWQPRVNRLFLFYVVFFFNLILPFERFKGLFINTQDSSSLFVGTTDAQYSII